MKNNLLILTLFLICIILSCSESIPTNQENKATNLKNYISEDSISALVNHLKLNSPDTFIFLNYWYGMPKEFIKILNDINLRNNNIISKAEWEYGEPDTNDQSENVYFVFHSKVELGSQINFTINDTTNTLEKVTLYISWVNKSKEENYENAEGKFIHNRIYSYEEENSIMQEVAILNDYLIELFGDNYNENFDLESSLWIHNQSDRSPHGNMIEQTIARRAYPPIKYLRWIKNNRYILSFCEVTNEYFTSESTKKRIINKYFDNEIIFTHVDYVKKKLTNKLKIEIEEKRKKAQKINIQKERI